MLEATNEITKVLFVYGPNDLKLNINPFDPPPPLPNTPIPTSPIVLSWKPLHVPQTRRQCKWPFESYKAVQHKHPIGCSTDFNDRRCNLLFQQPEQIGDSCNNDVITVS